MNKTQSKTWPGYELGLSRHSTWEASYQSDVAGLMIRLYCCGSDPRNPEDWEIISAYRKERRGEALLPHGPGELGVEIDKEEIPLGLAEAAFAALREQIAGRIMNSQFFELGQRYALLDQ
jgi:hypothetical protein